MFGKVVHDHMENMSYNLRYNFSNAQQHQVVHTKINKQQTYSSFAKYARTRIKSIVVKSRV